MEEIIFLAVVVIIIGGAAYQISTVDEPQIYFIEKVKCTVDDENIDYTFKKNYTSAFSTAEDGAVIIRDEQGYPVRTLTDATCDITYKRMVDDGSD